MTQKGDFISELQKQAEQSQGEGGIFHWDHVPEHLHSGGKVNSLPCVSEALLGVLAEMGFSQGSLAFGRAKKQYLREG